MSLQRPKSPAAAKVAAFERKEAEEAAAREKREADENERKRQVWKERIWSYFLGVLSGVTATLLAQYIPELLEWLKTLV